MHNLFATQHTTHHSTFASPLGSMLITASAQGLRGVWFQGQAHGPDWPDLTVNAPTPPHPALALAQTWLLNYFQRQPTGELPPLDGSVGTEFQRAVWRQLLTIPTGATRSYGDIAQALGKPQASRAVGAAVGRNPWSLLVPCHRVVGSTGALTGYAGGLARKKALLALEGTPGHTTGQLL